MIYPIVFLGEYDEARKYVNILISNAPNDNEMHIVLHQAGMIERMAANYLVAMDYFKQEEKIITKSFSNDDLKIATNLYEQGYVYMKMNNYDETIEKMELSLKHSKLSKDPICIGCSYRGMGEIMKKLKKDMNLAKSFFEKAVAAFQLEEDLIAVEEVKELMR